MKGVVLFFVVLPLLSWSDNGAHIFAVPTQPLVLDGDLSDWPVNAPQAAVGQVQQFDYPTGGDDARVRFQVSYDLAGNALFVAFDVHDDSWASPIASKLEHQDRLGLFLDFRRGEFNSSPDLRDNYYFHLRRDYQGWWDQVQPEWNPLGAVASVGQRVDGDRWVLEMKIDIGELTDGQITLEAGDQWGIDVAYYDVDEDQTVSEYHWGRGIAKYGRRLYGDLLLLAPGEALQSVTGQINAPIPAAGILRNFFALRSQQHAGWPELYVDGDAADQFEVVLPVGTYRIEDSAGEILEVVQRAAGDPLEKRVNVGPHEMRAHSLKGTKPNVVEAPPWEQDGHWFRYSIRQLFPGVSVDQLTVDPLGTLWITSNLGLLSFDGFRYQHFDLLDDDELGGFAHMDFDRVGDLWLAPKNGGVVRFHSKQFESLRIDPRLFQGIADVYADVENRVWFGGYFGLACIEKGRIRIANGIGNYRPAGVKSLAMTSQGSLWIAGPSNRLHRYYERQLAGVPGWEQDRSRYRRSYGTLVVNEHNGLYLNAKDGVVLSITDAPDLNDVTISTTGSVTGSILDMALGQRGELWAIGGSANRIAVGGAVRNRSLAEEFSFAMHAVACDSEGRVWVGSEFDGLARYRNANVNPVVIPGGINSYTCGVGFGEGQMAFGTAYQGLYVVRGDQVMVETQANTKGGLVSDEILDLLPDQQGGLWVGTREGVSYRDGEGQWQAIPNRPRGRADDLVWFDENDLWFRSDVKVYRWTNGTWSDPRIGEAEVSKRTNEVFGIMSEPGERIWLATGAGLEIWTPENQNVILPWSPEMTNVPRAMVASPDRQNYWMGVPAAGLFQLKKSDLGRGSRPTIEAYVDGSGQIDTAITRLLYDSRDRLWVGTKNGISMINKFGVVALGRRDGLPSGYVTDLANLSDGRMLVTTTDGAVVYSPHVQGPRLEGRLLTEGPIRSETDVLVVERDRAVSFVFRFSSTTTAEQQMAIRYRLVGGDEGWQSTNDTQIDFDGLEVGEYRLEAYALDRDLNLSRQPFSIQFSVVQPMSVWLMRFAWTGLVGLALFASGAAWVHVRQRDRARALLVKQTLDHNEALVRANEEADASRASAEYANRAKSEFLANISHEIRTPMNAIVGFSRFFRDPNLPNADRIRLAGSVERSSQQLLALVNQVLDFSKIEAGKFELITERFELQELVDELSELGREQCEIANLEWIDDSRISMPQYLLGDVGRIRQILLNLINNAVKFTETGTVTLRVESQAKSQDPLSSSKRGHSCCLKFSVEDTGPGIRENDQQAIFELFKQGLQGQRKGGTGLGLVIATKLARLMGGEIGVESEEGKGARFWLQVELSVDQASGMSEIGASVPSSRTSSVKYNGGLRLLIIDDVADNRLLLRMMLQSFGGEVREVSSGQEALELMGSWLPQVVLLDLVMPGMSGYELFERIRSDSRFDAVALVAVTALAFHHEREACLRKGFSGFLSKPVEQNALDELLASLVPRAPENEVRASVASGPSVGDFEMGYEQQIRLLPLVQQYRRTELKEELLVIRKQGDGAERFSDQCLELLGSGDWRRLKELIELVSRASVGSTVDDGERTEL